jgi:hypothetical protein
MSLRIQVLLTVLLLAGGLAFGGQDTVGNQQGPGINDRLGNLNGLCRLNGGTPGAYSEDSVKTRFYCAGGALDGLYCDVYTDLTYCYWDKVGTGASAPGSPQEITTKIQDLTFVTDLSVDAVTPLTLDVASEPMLVEAAITWNPSADATDQSRLDQVNACRHLGGTELVAGDSRELGTFTVVCDGGLLDGMWCSLGTNMTACFFAPGTGPDAAATDYSTMTPTEAPTVAMPTVAPAETSTASAEPTATVAPTQAPTGEPVIEPTFVDPATDDPWTVPEGTLHPLEPAPDPTEAPLT